MKKKILILLGIAIMSGAIVFSLFQPKMTVVKANGCPSSQAVSQDTGCNCTFLYSTSEPHPSRPGELTYCYYGCSCSGGGGGGHFEIEREVIVEN